MSDSITISTNLSRLSSLENETTREPFRVGVGASKFITFPDINDLPFEKADTIITQVEAADSGGLPSMRSLLESWLSEEDYRLLKEARPSMRTVAALIRSLMEYYQEAVGTPGEDGSSSPA
ncbi:hypothetical protein D5R93_05710 [Actinomyces lilanjuaniae]|uniref:Tail assembly chaperone n=1 Tax=Actinomyces lilanjuaniae TaxID=2321394 RepID=A0ABN5PMV9_9ACTO|nr:hypothetical protein [Actinomyces lilanjuaniae]AYD89668.1 hypothetical protein D5R93_05710 [Actinomyces lilanjuaniae]